MKIKWTRGAKQNLNQIKEYISKDNPKAAVNVVLRIIKLISMLADNPAMGKNGRVFGTRELIISGTPFIVPYRVIEGNIEILRLFHGSRQWTDIL